jgi:cytochrome c peroxidase
MSLSVGDKLPSASLGLLGADGPEQVDLNALIAGKKAVIFAVPGAYTPTCSSAHMPGFVRNAEKLRAKGVDEIICISVNDVFVMKSWGDAMGATEVGIHSLADGDSSFTKAIGMDFSAPPVGLIDRSKRYAMIVEDGTVTALNAEESPGVCDVSGGENILDLL